MHINKHVKVEAYFYANVSISNFELDSFQSLSDEILELRNQLEDRSQNLFLFGS